MTGYEWQPLHPLEMFLQESSEDTLRLKSLSLSLGVAKLSLLQYITTKPNMS